MSTAMLHRATRDDQFFIYILPYFIIRFKRGREGPQKQTIVKLIYRKGTMGKMLLLYFQLMCTQYREEKIKNFVVR